MLLAGASRLVITPPLEVPCGAFGEWNPRHFTGIAADIHVRALVLKSDSPAPIAVVSVEATETCESVMRSVRNEVERRAQIPARNVLIAMTHTHCAPALMQPSAPYVQVTQQKIADAVVIARQRLRPALLGTSTQQIPGPATNRRILLKNGRVWPRFFVGPRIPTRETAAEIFSQMDYGPNVDYRTVPEAADIVGPGPVNQDLTVIKITDREDGAFIAALAHYACHATAALESLNIHGDFPGFACATVEEAKGGVCMFFAGASANINCNAFLRERTDAEARRLGAQFSDQILTGLAAAGSSEAEIECNSVRVILPLRDEMKPEVNQALRQALVGKPEERERLREADRISHEIEILENLIRKGVLPPVIQQGEVEVEISAARIGKHVVITIPGELFVEIGARIATLSSDRQPVLVITHCNGGVGYIPEKAAFGQGGYEDSPCYGAFVGPRSEQCILDACRQLLATR